MWGSSVGCTRLTGVDRFERVGEVGQRGANAFRERRSVWASRWRAGQRL
jgi:hypothetical protein